MFVEGSDFTREFDGPAVDVEGADKFDEAVDAGVYAVGGIIGLDSSNSGRRCSSLRSNFGWRYAVSTWKWDEYIQYVLGGL